MTVSTYTEPFTGPDALAYEKALSPRFCESLVSLAGTDMRLSRGRIRVRRLKDRDNRVVLGEVKRLVTLAGERHFGVDATGAVPVLIGMSLHEYVVGSVMSRHYDNQIEGKAAGPMAASVGQPPVGRQPYACCIYLTDPDQYGGGDLLIDGYAPLRPELGDAVFFRGDVMHSVNRITDGIRHVLRVSIYLNMRNTLTK